MASDANSFVIAGGFVVDPANSHCAVANVFVSSGKVVEVSSRAPGPNSQVFDASGLTVAPGLIDVHVHLRDPGLEYKEDISTGTMAAAAGGFTTVFAMPNTNPVCDSAKVVKYVRERAAKFSFAKVIPVGAITQSLFGKILSPFEEMQREGMIAISDDGACVADDDVMYLAALKAKSLGIHVITHPEDRSISAGGIINDGNTARRMNLKGVPREAENSIISRDISICKRSGAHIHIAHVSTKEGISLVKSAKREGLNLTCEVAPHHLFLTDEAVIKIGANAKVNPPLRERADCDALIEAILDGTVDMIATDHAPHSPDEKDDIITAPFGVIGLETSLQMSLRLVHEGMIDMSKLISLMSFAPAKIFGLNAGSLSRGMPADIVLFDQNLERTIDAAKFHSKGRNCPFDGMNVKGGVMATYLDGNRVYSAAI